jgi:fructose-bisphosphate aldolase/2-amino-3,7-dideoxy-D-threo-hept-6-ulosonate synthase
MERIMNRDSGNMVLIPMDHGVTMGPVKGLIDMAGTIDEVVSGGADSVLMHKGMVEHGHRGGGEDVGLVIHMSASTELGQPDRKILCARVDEAIRLGADGVSIHVNLGAEEEPEMLKKFGTVARECQKWGLPLIAMMYVRGPDIDDEYAADTIAHAARAGAELGADIIKCNYSGDPESFRDVVEGCPVPLVIAGGAKTDTTRSVLEMVHGAMDAGARGVSIGRNVFQAENPGKMVRAISAIVHDDSDVDTAESKLQ